MKSEILFALFILAFWLAVYILSKILPLDKYGVEVKPLLLKYNSEGFKRLLYKFSSRWRRLWIFFSHISILLGFGLMLFAIIFLSGNLLEFLLPGGEGAVITPVIPGLTLSLHWLPYFLVAVIVAVFTHETAHGIIALIEGIDIKSAGALLLAIFFGGFVEIDEEKINKLPNVSRMRIFSAGSSSNILWGLMVFLILLALFTQSSSGIVVLEVLEGGPLDAAGIRRWDVIYALNGTMIRTYQDLMEFMSDIRPGDTIIVSTNRGDFTIRTIPSPDDSNKAIIGIVSPILQYYPSRIGLSPFWNIQVYLTLNWLLLILVNVAVFNMLPIPLLDGDRFLQCLLERIAGRSDALRRFFNVLSLLLIAANMIVGMRH